MKWSTVFEVAPASDSIAIRDGEPKFGAGVASVGAGITARAMSFGAAVEVLGDAVHGDERAHCVGGGERRGERDPRAARAGRADRA